MIEFLRLILHIIASFFKPRTKLVVEILILRQQLNVLRRQVSKRPQLSNADRFLFVWLYRWFPSVLSAIAILRPETIIRWHRAGFQSYWREQSRKRVGRPRISAELRNLIGRPGTTWRGVTIFHFFQKYNSRTQSMRHCRAIPSLRCRHATFRWSVLP